VGTRDGELVRSREALYAPGGLLHHLAHNGGLRLFPPSAQVRDHPRYNGGHIVAEFGYNQVRGVEVNAVQLEFGINLRMRPNGRSDAVQAFADALHALAVAAAANAAPASEA